MNETKFGMLIGGRLVSTDRTFDVLNPADGSVAGRAPEVDAAGIEAALAAARDAFPAWSATPLSGRRAAILRYADALEREKDAIVDLLIAETGKPADNAEYDFGMLTQCLRFFVEEAARLDQPAIPDPDGRFLHYLLRQPLGVVVGYLAWNFPLLNVGYKLGPALAAGCTAILKPSRETPLATLRCAELSIEAGLPPGVVNIVTGTDHEITKPLLESPIPKLFTMIGSTAAGVKAIRTACTNVKHFSVELGGNAPAVVYNDADVADAAEKIIDLKFANTGQVCVSPNRCFVHESVVDAFLDSAMARASGLVLAAGRGGGRRMGPMISAKERARVMDSIDAAVRDGAKIVLGGRIPAGRDKGFWFEPTILRDVSRSMRLSCKEIFGPILPVLAFGDSDDPISLANDTEYGLAAYVFTTDLSRGLRAAAGIQAGSVCVNEPHYAVHLPHGGMKQSGVGRDCSRYSLEEYMTLKRVSIRM